MELSKVNNKKVLLYIISILVLCVIGVSFAFFISGDRVSGDGGNAGGVTRNLIKVTYDAGNGALTATDLYPGKSASKEFDVKITPTLDEKSVKYGIYLNISTNTFTYCTDPDSGCLVNASELSYNLKDSAGSVIISGDLTEKSGKVLLLEETKTVDTETNFDYTLEILFNETNHTQEHNTNKSIVGEIKVELVD